MIKPAFYLMMSAMSMFVAGTVHGCLSEGETQNIPLVMSPLVIALADNCCPGLELTSSDGSVGMCTAVPGPSGGS